MVSGGMLGQALKSSQDVRERLQGVGQGVKSEVIRNSVMQNGVDCCSCCGFCLWGSQVPGKVYPC